MSAADKGKRVYILTLEKKHAPSRKPRGIVIGAAAAPMTLISEEEELIPIGMNYSPIHRHARGRVDRGRAIGPCTQSLCRHGLGGAGGSSAKLHL